MPRTNVIKNYSPNSFYHVYNRGVNKRDIFIDQQDRVVFFNLLKRYLSNRSSTDSFNRVFTYLGDKIELNAYCLMPNHFHLLFYLKEDAGAIVDLMRCVFTCYSKYFNNKYSRVGHLFESPYKAVPINNYSQLLYISKYIHKNPTSLGEDYRYYDYSSYKFYVSSVIMPSWLNPSRIRDLFKDAKDYEKFMMI